MSEQKDGMTYAEVFKLLNPSRKVFGWSNPGRLADVCYALDRVLRAAPPESQEQQIVYEAVAKAFESLLQSYLPDDAHTMAGGQ
jgi:hypothetical protein